MNKIEILFMSMSVWLSLFTIYDIIVTTIDNEKLNKAVRKDNEVMYRITQFIVLFPIGYFILNNVLKLFN